MNGDLFKFAGLHRINKIISDPKMRQQHLKFCILFLFVSILSTVTQAQSKLYVHQIDGRQQSYALSGIRKLSFPAENMVVSFKSIPSVSYSLAGIQYCNFRYISTWPGIDVSVYPNPTADKLIIECSEVLSELILFDITGRKVMQVLPKTSSTILQLGHFSSGIYILHILTTRSKIVKEIIKN